MKSSDRPRPRNIPAATGARDDALHPAAKPLNTRIS